MTKNGMRELRARRGFWFSVMACCVSTAAVAQVPGRGARAARENSRRSRPGQALIRIIHHSRSNP